MTETPSLKEGKGEESPSSTTHDAHDITSLSDLPLKRMKTKMWPMSPIESLSAEEVMAIANRDQTPVLIAVMEGDDTGEKYLCSSKKGATIPPEMAAEGPWAQKCYQQVAVLNTTIKDLRAEFQPVWELVKAQQMMLIAVELFDGLQQVANKGLRRFYNTWSREDAESIITSQCDFRNPRQVDYFRVLKNYTRGGFSSLDQQKFQWVEDLLLEGEKYLQNHAQRNGFYYPPNVRDMFKEFLHIKKDRNIYSHPLTLAKEGDAYSSLQILKNSINSDEFPYFRNTKNLLLLGTDYAESILKAYGKLKGGHFLDPKGRGKHPLSPPDSDSSSNSPREDSAANSPLRLYSPNAEHLLYDKHYQVGQSSRHLSSPLASPPRNPSPGSPPIATQSQDQQPLAQPPPKEFFRSPPSSPPPKALSAASPAFVPRSYVSQPPNPLKRPSTESVEPSESNQSSQQGIGSSPSRKNSLGSQSKKQKEGHTSEEKD